MTEVTVMMEVDTKAAQDTKDDTKKRSCDTAPVEPTKRQKVDNGETTSMKKIVFSRVPVPYKTKPIGTYTICLDGSCEFGKISRQISQVEGLEIPFPKSIMVHATEKNLKLAEDLQKIVNKAQQTARAFLCVRSIHMILAFGLSFQNDEIYFPLWTMEQRVPKFQVDACVICLEKVANQVIFPCMHMCLCETCVPICIQQNMATCPKCRVACTQVSKVYF